MSALTEEATKVVWRGAPARWGHPLHSLCSYMAMFPPSIPHVFISWLTSPGDVVYDPFSGRGTTALEACLLGRVGMGSDLNPMANVLTSAKTHPPTYEQLVARVQELKSHLRPLALDDEPEAIRGVFAPGTLGQLLWLRQNLDRSRYDDVFILATLLGILHLNADSNGFPKGLTVAMPNTFAMAPGYVLNYIDEHGLVRPEVDVLDMVERRLQKYQHSLQLSHRGASWKQDATLPGLLEEQQIKARLVFSSPPYLHVIKYGKFNWLRLWLLGEDPRLVDHDLFASSSLPRYLDFMRRVIQRLERVVREDGYICLVIGDVATKGVTTKLAEEVANACVPEAMRVEDIVVDELPGTRKVSRIWGETKGRATKTDRILVLAHRDGPALPTMPTPSWQAT